MKKRLLIISGIGFVALLLFFVIRAMNRSDNSEPAPVPGPEKHLRDYPAFEGENHTDPPDIRVERLPDGSRIEYGSYQGRMSPEVEAEMKKLVEREKEKIQQNRTPTNTQSDASVKGWNTVHAAGPADTIVFETVTAPQTMVDHLRSLFANRILYWTDRDLAALDRIRIVDSQGTLGGALGLWTHVKSKNPDGTFIDLKGMIWVWKDGPVEQALLHEYGHHYTNYWGAHRLKGAGAIFDPVFAPWPKNPAGDYYLLRPLRDGCHCSSFDIDPITNQPVCPYTNRVWEILAEDYRMTATAFNAGHFFSNSTCPGISGTVGMPDLAGTSAYMAALPLSGGAIVATPAQPYPSPTAPAPTCLAVQHCTRGNTILHDTCGSCTGVGCTPGYTCPDLTYTCSSYQQKIYASDVLYPIPCPLLSPTPRPLGAADDIGILASYFPRVPFVACYDRGGVCTFQDTCLKFDGTTFERNATICPTSEGCCTFPNPVPIVRGQTECEKESGVCTSIPAACTLQGGTSVAGKGCAFHCCQFPSNPNSYKNQEYRDIMKRVREGRMSSMAVTAWLENACRTPRLQNVYCDPHIEGDCERMLCIPRSP